MGMVHAFDEKVVPEGKLLLLKQASPARWRVSSREDLPQAILMAAFAYRRGRSSVFVLVSMGISATRLILSGTGLGKWIRAGLRDELASSLTNTANAGNVLKAAALVRQMLDAGVDDPTQI